MLVEPACESDGLFSKLDSREKRPEMTDAICEYVLANPSNIEINETDATVTFGRFRSLTGASCE
jgi:hypothetical protein